MKNINTDYESRLVAFIDIIGWQEANKINPISSQIKEAIGIFAGEHEFRKNQYKNEVRKQFGDKTNPFFLGVECAIFSDNIIISMPWDFKGRIFDLIGGICRKLLAIGFLTRGGVTIGNLYHEENIIFGPALNEAVKLEAEANFPRILCSPELINQYNGWGSTIPSMVTDPLGRNVANLFITPLCAGSETIGTIEELLDIPKIRIIIEGNMEKFSSLGPTKLTDAKKYEKWYYLRSLMEIQLKKIWEP